MPTQENGATDAQLVRGQPSSGELQTEIATLEHDIAALEQEYTQRLEAFGNKPLKQGQMYLSLVLFVVGSLVFMARITVPGVVLLTIAIGLAFDVFLKRRQLQAQKMAIYTEGETLWNNKQAALAEKREEMQALPGTTPALVTITGDGK